MNEHWVLATEFTSGQMLMINMARIVAIARHEETTELMAGHIAAGPAGDVHEFKIYVREEPKHFLPGKPPVCYSKPTDHLDLYPPGRIEVVLGSPLDTESDDPDTR